MRMAVLALLAGLLLGPAALAQEADEAAAFEAMAQELVRGIERTAGMLDKLRIKAGLTRSAGVWPFPSEKVPVPDATAKRWNERLLDGLVRRSPPWLSLVTRTDLDTIINEISASDVDGDVEDPVAEVLRAAKVDIIIKGTIEASPDGMHVQYRAVDRSGRLLATSRPRVIPADVRSLGAEGAVSLDAAIADAAARLAEIGPAMKRLQVRPLHEATRELPTPFGRRVAERVADALQERMRNVLSGQGLQVLAAPDEKAVLAMRGVKVAAKDMERVGADERDFVLTGSYMVLGDVVEVRLAARSGAGEGLAVTRRVLRDSVGGLPLLPAGAEAGARDMGPLGLTLSSAKGRNPSYRIGEKMVLTVRTDADSWLHCFYTQADKTTLKILPNPWGDGRVKGGALATIPDDRSAFDFTIGEPTGRERLRCFALDRDVTAKLPKEVARSDLQPLSTATVQRLDEIFNALPDVRISQASMVVTVEK